MTLAKSQQYASNLQLYNSLKAYEVDEYGNNILLSLEPELLEKLENDGSPQYH